MKNFIRNILVKRSGTKGMQRIYEALYRISLQGMNYGNGGVFTESGEMNVLQYLKTHFTKGQQLTIFDVGGNIGNYSKALAEQFFHASTTIHAFEPSSKTFEIFSTNTAHLKNVIANNLGLGEAKKSILLYSNTEGSGLASVYHRNLEHFGISMDQHEEIKISTIDDYCRENNVARINFLKLDIEGNELNALKGATEMLNSKKIDFIQFEFGGCNIDSRTYFQDFFYLLRDNYRIYRILKDGLAEITNYKESNEIFITINYLAELRS